MVQYEVQHSTHNVVHQLLSIPPPPPPPARPWLYLPYGRQMRSERGICRMQGSAKTTFGVERRQMNAIIVATEVEPEEGAGLKKKEQEDTQSLD